MKLRDALSAVAALLVAALCVHGLVGESGAVAWVSAAQIALVGSYSLGLSMIVVACGLAVVATIAWLTLMRSSADDDDDNDEIVERMLLGPPPVVRPALPPVAPPLSAARLWLGCGVAVAATWLLGLVAWAAHFVLDLRSLLALCTGVSLLLVLGFGACAWGRSRQGRDNRLRRPSTA